MDKQKTLIVMGGEGAKNWIRRPQKVPVYAPGHEVILPDLDALARVWYGRMYFPARHAKLLDTSSTGGEPQTFGHFLTQSYNAFKYGRPEAALALGCHPSRRALADESSCSGDQIYCWMSCQPVVRGAGEDCAKEEALCVAPDGALWPRDFTTADGTIQHCTSCVAKCPVPPPAPNATSNATVPQEGELCNKHFQATVMWMTGFQSAEDASQPCVALLFQSWVLDTRLKFALGCLGTALVGVLVEWIVHSRRRLAAFKDRLHTPHRRALFKAVMLAIYAMQVTLGYMLMLIAMTYEVELFVMVVLGLAAGHGLFNLQAPVLDSAEACCMGHDASSPNLRAAMNGSGLEDTLLTNGKSPSKRDEHPNCCPCPSPGSPPDLTPYAAPQTNAHHHHLAVDEVEESHVVVVGDDPQGRLPGCHCE